VHQFENGRAGKHRPDHQNRHEDKCQFRHVRRVIVRGRDCRT
jgi:hypothetical protein